ncbi:MAG: glycosyl transferase [Chloroflexus sp.]|uniref:glycosyltransferase family 2 protein n=1 Tax=Chloroflexus sp. TaxID=1904827 RepID=UPI0021DCA88C|nr:glycosyltransferase family 2 protein [Chloroflexus sp.]GIV90042.1 MAG: glycosyl transferase [Chloroflexus sp.]
MMRLSIAIIARDEAAHIAGCLRSIAGLSDDVVVIVDAQTRDETAAIAAAHGAQVWTEPWRGFSAQRNLALQRCRGEWVLFIDADERLTPQLFVELATLLYRNPPDTIAGYRIPRYNLFFGRRLRGGGWYPDYQLRLLRRDAARYDERVSVHEVATLSGAVAELHGHLLHLNIERLDELWQKQARYAWAEATMLYRNGRRMRLRNLIGAPAREFIRRYLQLGGWRDGWLGLFLCATLAWHEVVKFCMLRGLQESDTAITTQMARMRRKYARFR